MEEKSIQQFDLLVEGRISEPLSRKYFDCVNPSNGEVFARVADADEIAGLGISASVSQGR